MLLDTYYHLASVHRELVPPSHEIPARTGGSDEENRANGRRYCAVCHTALCFDTTFTGAWGRFTISVRMKELKESLWRNIFLITPLALENT